MKVWRVITPETAGTIALAQSLNDLEQAGETIHTIIGGDVTRDGVAIITYRELPIVQTDEQRAAIIERERKQLDTERSAGDTEKLDTIDLSDLDSRMMK